MFGKNSIPIFKDVSKLLVTESFVKNQEFVWKPTSEKLEYLILQKNDYFGVIKFNILYNVVYYKRKYVNLKHLEFEGEVDE